GGEFDLPAELLNPGSGIDLRELVFGLVGDRLEAGDDGFEFPIGQRPEAFRGDFGLDGVDFHLILFEQLIAPSGPGRNGIAGGTRPAYAGLGLSAASGCGLDRTAELARFDRLEDRRARSGDGRGGGAALD